MTSPTAVDSVEYRGIWWLPESPDDHVCGVATFSAESGTKLELIGSLSKPNTVLEKDEHGVEYKVTSIGIDSEFSIIHGLTTTGEKCTLYSCTQTNLSMPFSGFKSEVYYAAFLFVGTHFANVDDIQFSCFDIEFSGVDEWMNQLPWEYSITQDYTNDTMFHEAKISFDDPIDVPLSGTDFTFRLCRPASIEYDRYSTLSWKKKFIVELKCTEPRNLEWFRWTEYDSQNFLTLLIGEPIFRNNLVAYGKEYTNAFGKSTTDEIKVFFRRTKTKEFKSVKIREVLIPYVEIKDSIGMILSNWFSLAPRLRNTYNLYFGALYNDYIYPEAFFLTLMQAIETFHRTTRDGTYIEKAIFKKFRDAIIAAFPQDLPSELRDSLASRIGYGNEHSLRMRIEEIFASLGADLSTIITEDAQQFVRRIVATRNYYTHYDEGSKKNSIEREDLFYANSRLRLLIAIILLKEIGVSDDVISKSMKRHVENFPLMYKLDIGTT